MPAAAGPEVPYQLLRRGNGYEIRPYPAHSVAKIPYERRDEGYDVLASLTKGTYGNGERTRETTESRHHTASVLLFLGSIENVLLRRLLTSSSFLTFLFFLDPNIFGKW